MKKFLKDTCRIFLLQFSKVIWDIIGWTIFVYYIFYLTYESFYYSVMIAIIFTGCLITIRLYFDRCKKNIIENEYMLPVNFLSYNIATFSVIILYFLITYFPTAYLTLDYRLAKIFIWLNENNIINIDYNNSILESYREITKYNNNNLFFHEQIQTLKFCIYYFWIIVIPIAFILQFSMKIRIYIVVLLISLTILTVLVVDSDIYIHLFGNLFAKISPVTITFNIVLLLFIILIKRINLKK